MKSTYVNIHWPLVITTTVILYVLIIVTLPFNSITSTVLLFSLIAYWSRIPGVGMYSPFYFIYHTDVVDLFSLIIAVNVGGTQGGILAIFGNMASRAAGFTPAWQIVVKDSVIQFLLCIIAPYFHPLCGYDIFVSMMVYSILRRIGFMIAYFIHPDIPLIPHIIRWTGATFSQVIINVFQAKFFGGFFDSILKNGVNFNWMLFLYATAIILIGKIILLGFSNEKRSYGLTKKILKKVIAHEKLNEKKKETTESYDDRFIKEIKNEI